MAKRKPRKKVKSDTKIAVIDAETDPFRRGRIPEPFLWGFYDGETYEEFENTEELVGRVSAFEGIVYAHNGGKFDFHFILKHLERGSPISLINGRLVECKLGAATLRDSYALLPAPLSAYKKDEISYKIFEKKERVKPHNKRKISEYLRGDCVYLFDMVKQFIDVYGLHLTQAGAAMKTFLKMSKLEAPKSSKKFFEKFSQFYYGGRVEVFKAGKIDGPLQLFDINSAYPWAMLSKHPFRCDYVEINNPTIDKVKDTSFIEVICNSKGALPYRDDKNRITFPETSEPRRFYCVGHEFNKARALGLVSDYSISRLYNFIIEEDFSGYIKHFYELRLRAKEKIELILAGKCIESLEYWTAQDLFAKLLMNSLYGKFGANPENYGHYTIAEDGYDLSDYSAGGYLEYAEIDGVSILRADLLSEEQRYYNVATAASITSQVRAKLLGDIVESKGVKYCDTDSILCEEFAGDIGKELGQWKLEADIKTAWIAGKKMYCLEKAKRDKKGLYKMASKGVRLEPKDIKDMCAGKSIINSPIAPTFSMKKEPSFTKRQVKMLDEIAALM